MSTAWRQQLSHVWGQFMCPLVSMVESYFFAMPFLTLSMPNNVNNITCLTVSTQTAHEKLLHMKCFRTWMDTAQLEDTRTDVRRNKGTTLPVGMSRPDNCIPLMIARLRTLVRLSHLCMQGNTHAAPFSHQYQLTLTLNLDLDYSRLVRQEESGFMHCYRWQGKRN